MTYGDTSLTEAERNKKKRMLTMEQLSFDADLKRNKRSQDDIAVDLSRFKRDLARLEVVVSEKEAELKKLQQQETFFAGESQRIKKALVNLR